MRMMPQVSALSQLQPSTFGLTIISALDDLACYKDSSQFPAIMSFLEALI